MNYYSTSDLGLITALSLHFKVIDVDDVDLRRVQFIFEETPELLEEVDKYFNDELMVSALSFTSKMKQIKNRLYNSGKGYLYK